MSRTSVAVAGSLVLAVTLFAAGREVGFAQQPATQGAQPPAALMLIERFDIAPGRPVSEAIEEASGWVREMRRTGEYNSVKLYVHNYGPELAVYVITEPKSWQALKNGEEKFFAARPELMTTPFRWAGHSDNILTEVPVR